MSFFYLLPSLTNGIQGFMRGMGKMRITLISTTIQVVLRVIFTFILINFMGIESIAIACAVGWIMMILFEYPYTYFMMRKRRSS